MIQKVLNGGVTRVNRFPPQVHMTPWSCRTACALVFLILCFYSDKRTVSCAPASDLEIGEWIVGVRRDLHRIPELGFTEEKTSKYVRDTLDQLGIRYKHPVAKTGVLGMVGAGAPIVALRSDMDALPIKEAVDVDFKSLHEGRMHACGHDAHMAMLLGAAKVLKEREGELQGTVLLVFQPAEEGLGGGKVIAESGALRGVQAIHGLHVWPDLPSGVLASKPGTIFAGSTSFEAVVRGRGGHAAMPHLTTDPVVAAAAVVQALQPLVSRETDPVDSAVISVSRFNTGEGATNVIPDDVALGGTVRALSEDTFKKTIDRVAEVMTKTVEAYGCDLDIQWREPPYPPTVNDESVSKRLAELGRHIAGAKWLDLENPTLGAEDFSFLARALPAAFTWLGIRNETAGSTHALHTPRFQVDESVLHLGAALHTEFAMSYARGQGPSHTEL